MTLLGDVVDMTFGFAFKSRDFTDDPSDVRLLRGDNVGQGRLRWDSAKRLPAALAREFTRYQLRAGDVVLAMDRPWIEAGLKFAVVRESDLPSLLVQRVARLRARSELDQGYLGCIIRSRGFTDHIRGVQTGSAVPHISGRQIGEYPVRDLPSVEEQRAIAATLGVLDNRIESNERAIAIGLELVDAYARAVSESMVAAVPLAELALVSRTIVDPGTLGDERVHHFSIPAFDGRAWPERIDASEIKSNKLLVSSPTILISRLNPRFNRTWWCVPSDEVLSLASTEFIALTAENPVALATLWLAVRDGYFRSELKQRVTGTSGSHQRIRPDDLLEIEVPDVRGLPLTEKQRAYELLTLIHQRRREARRLASLRDALLPELLSGRVRVPEARDAVESAA